MTGSARSDCHSLITVSGEVPADLRHAIDEGRRPRADYVEIADASEGTVLDRRAARRVLGRAGPIIERLGGANLTMALACFAQRRTYRSVLSDGEQVGIPYAVLSRLSRCRPRHVMIGHRLSPRKKALLHRLLRVQRRVDVVVVYSSEQRRVAIEELGYARHQVVLRPFMVDTAFWRTENVDVGARERPLICAVGQELRDYPTMAEAVRGLDVDVLIAASSPWSKREDTSADLDVPSNVTVRGLDLHTLRQVYAEAALVVVPLQETDFQAGITTILEAMSMGRAVICSRTTGQTDTLVDEETGLYVPPADPRALRDAITRLLEDPAEAARLGEAGRRWVHHHADIDQYARELASLLDGATAPAIPRDAGAPSDVSD